MSALYAGTVAFFNLEKGGYGKIIVNEATGETLFFHISRHATMTVLDGKILLGAPRRTKSKRDEKIVLRKGDQLVYIEGPDPKNEGRTCAILWVTLKEYEELANSLPATMHTAAEPIYRIRTIIMRCTEEVVNDMYQWVCAQEWTGTPMSYNELCERYAQQTTFNDTAHDPYNDGNVEICYSFESSTDGDVWESIDDPRPEPTSNVVTFPVARSASVG